jgi:uracil phosphoribosyltransferase
MRHFFIDSPDPPHAAPKSIKFLCLLICLEGIATMHKAIPDVATYAAAIDRQRSEHRDILPGLGDAGDCIFGTSEALQAK